MQNAKLTHLREVILLFLDSLSHKTLQVAKSLFVLNKSPRRPNEAWKQLIEEIRCSLKINSKRAIYLFNQNGKKIMSGKDLGLIQKVLLVSHQPVIFESQLRSVDLQSYSCHTWSLDQSSKRLRVCQPITKPPQLSSEDQINENQLQTQSIQQLYSQFIAKAQAACSSDDFLSPPDLQTHFRTFKQQTTQSYIIFKSLESLGGESGWVRMDIVEEVLPLMLGVSDFLVKKILGLFKNLKRISLQTFEVIFRKIKASSTNQKFSIFLELVDKDNDGFITREEIQDLLNQCIQKYVQAPEVVKFVKQYVGQRLVGSKTGRVQTQGLEVGDKQQVVNWITEIL